MTSDSFDQRDESWFLDPALNLRITSARVLLIESGPTVHRIANKDVVDAAEPMLANSRPEVVLPAATPDGTQELVRDLMTVITNMGLAVPGPITAADRDFLGLYFETRRRAPHPLGFNEYRDRLQQSSVHVVGSGRLTDAISSELEHIGVSPLIGAGEQVRSRPDIAIYVADGEWARGVADFNRTRIEDGAGTPWLLIQPFDGARTYIGPLIAPEASACAECYRLRRLSNFPDDDVSEELEDALMLSGSGVTQAASVSHSFVAGMSAQIILDYLFSGFDGPTSTPGFVQVLTNTTSELSLKSHRVLRVPRCQLCAPARGTGSPQIWFPQGAPTEATQHA